MLSIFNSLHLGDVVIIIIGIVLLLKRVVEMDRYHKLRVVVLTSILSCIVIYSVFATGLVFSNNSCYMSFSD